jgi:hypothetical protein
MKIISFDIGIKNMAYCLFDISEKTKEDGDKENLPKITDWKVLSLLAEEPKIHKCSCLSKITKKNIAPPSCGRKAKFSHTRENNQIFLCDKHAKSLVKDSAYLMPESRFKNVKKNNMDGLLALATELKITELPKKRADVLIIIQKYLDLHLLEPVKHTKEKAGEADLVSLGQAIKKVFKEVVDKNPDISVVLIENQISPLANRMKTVQGMLAQYFIMMYDTIHIEFVSSANKLKIFDKENQEKKDKEQKQKGEPEEKQKEEKKDKTQSQIYKEHKKDGLVYCEKVLKEISFEGGEQWDKCEKKKKDDLADCFLQGVWWIKKYKYI